MPDKVRLLQEQLQRYRDHLTKVGSERTVPAAAEPRAPAPVVIEHRFALTHQHGSYALGEFPAVLARWERMGLAHPLRNPGIQPGEVLFFDTETTGLHGGAGTTIFLFGSAHFEGDAVVVRQHFLSSPAGEAAVFESFLASLQGVSQLITFNGKTFDWPQVVSRHTLLRGSVSSLPRLDHLDLLHPARRLWAEELPSCRLGDLEARLLGLVRDDDISGEFAPAFYFDYLRHGELARMEPIFRHNRLDVLSLIALYVHLSRRILDYAEGVIVPSAETLAIARWWEALGHSDAALAGYERVAGSEDRLALEARIGQGRILKRRGDWRGSLEAWESCLPHLPPGSYRLRIEIAKLYEHKARDYPRALHHALEAQAALNQRARLMRRPAPDEETLVIKRVERLRQKLGRLDPSAVSRG